ncbi:hypothetical protein STEG23_024700 [Scotinomys teguina]
MKVDGALGVDPGGMMGTNDQNTLCTGAANAERTPVVPERRLQLRDCMNLRRDFEHLTFNRLDILIFLFSTQDSLQCYLWG